MSKNATQMRLTRLGEVRHTVAPYLRTCDTDSHTHTYASKQHSSQQHGTMQFFDKMKATTDKVQDKVKSTFTSSVSEP